MRFTVRRARFRTSSWADLGSAFRPFLWLARGVAFDPLRTSRPLTGSSELGVRRMRVRLPNSLHVRQPGIIAIGVPVF